MRQGLADELRRMDGGPYGQYKRLSGVWQLPGCQLRIVRGQPDPFAPPARVAVRVTAEDAGFAPDLRDTPVRRRAVASFLARRVARLVRQGPLRVDAGGQEVLDRSSCVVGADGSVTVRLGVPLPGRGRRVDGPAAVRVLCEQVPEVAREGLRHAALDRAALRRFVDTVEDSVALRAALPERGLVAFVADGAVLPRRSGVDDRPAREPDAVPFTAPDSLRVSIDLPHAGTVTGMGVPEGVTLVVGGGFHGKSTLLRALESGVWDHVPGDGRELVVSRADTVKVRSEDGRRVTRVDVHPFVGRLPTGTDTTDFTTDNASGSTSQAAALCEAVEAGARVLLIDEDTAATNLMIRDARMQALVAKDREPLTPFVDLVGSLHRDHGVSTVLVMGGSGDYMEVADRVLLMDAYRPSDVTARAREVATGIATGRTAEADRFPALGVRVPLPASVDATAKGRARVRSRGEDTLAFGEQDVDLRAVEQIADGRHVVGIGLAMAALVDAGHLDGRRTLREALDRLADDLTTDRLLAVRDDDFAVPRALDVAAALNRLRSLEVHRPTD